MFSCLLYAKIVSCMEAFFQQRSSLVFQLVLIQMRRTFTTLLFQLHERTCEKQNLKHDVLLQFVHLIWVPGYIFIPFGFILHFPGHTIYCCASTAVICWMLPGKQDFFLVQINFSIQVLAILVYEEIIYTLS